MYTIRKANLIFGFAAALMIIVLFSSGCSVFEKSEAEIAGTQYPVSSKKLVLDKLDSADYPELKRFKKLELLDVTAVDLSVEDYKALSGQVVDSATIIWTVPINSQKIDSNTSELHLSGELSDDDIHAVSFFKNIRKLEIDNIKIGKTVKAAADAARRNNPDVEIIGKASLYGVDFDNSTETLILNNKKIKSLNNVKIAIELFPNIKTIEMCNCGVSNENMQELREKYPNVKFIWIISFLHYKLRTDIQVFSMLAADPSRPGNSKTFEPLFKYCTELRALDLGHMRITDISEIRNLKKLHTLILADNSISDISPLAELKELVFLELFFNKIKDVSPLAEIPNLEDVNLCYNSAMKNPDAMTNCKSLKRLYISHCSLDENEIAALKKGVPKGCELNYTAQNSVHSGWRTNKNKRSVIIREAFKNWKKVKAYPTWDKIIYK